jgi:phosphoglycerol transferase MdoB-like AlkP superfamily enzyme
MITVGISVFHFGMLFDLVLMMFWIGAFAFLMKTNRMQKIYYIIVAFIMSVFVIGDSVYYDYFETISAMSSLDGLKWLQNGTTLEYNIQIPLVAILVVPLFIGFTILIIKSKKKDTFKFRDFQYLSLIFVLQVGLFLLWGNQTFDSKIEYYRSDAYLFESMHDRSLYSEKYGYFNYHLLDMTKIRPKLDYQAEYTKVDAFFDEQSTHQTNEKSDIYAGYNVVTILGESLETRFIDPVLTPNLYMMKTNGMVFDNFYTTVYQQGATCNSEYMSLTGLNAITSNDWSNNICDSYSNNAFTYSLPNQLNDIGYNTYYFHSGHEWFYNRETIVPSYGFDTVKFQEDLIENGYPDYNEKFDTEMLDFWETFVTFDEPFYVNMLTYSMHGAYNQDEFEIHRDQFDSAYPNQSFDSQVENYMLKLIEFDTMLGDIMDYLDDNGQLDNTLFAVYPDHYPYMMKEETYLNHIELDDDKHEMMRQNLFIYATNMTGEVVSKPGSTKDITPTLLNMIHSDSNFDYFVGQDLFSNKDNYILFSDLTITDGANILYLDERYIGNTEDLLDLENALESRITAYEIEKLLLNIDYFKMKAEND